MSEATLNPLVREPLPEAPSKRYALLRFDHLHPNGVLERADDDWFEVRNYQEALEKFRDESPDSWAAANKATYEIYSVAV